MYSNMSYRASSRVSASPRIGFVLDTLEQADIEPSVGIVGDSYDNALAETIKGRFKAEVIHCHGPWRNFEAVAYATLECVDWFNSSRLHEPIGNIPPAKAKANYYAALETEPMAAELTPISLRQTRRGSWWVMRDSNSRHLRCKRSALPTELIARPLRPAS